MTKYKDMNLCGLSVSVAYHIFSSKGLRDWCVVDEIVVNDVDIFQLLNEVSIERIENALEKEEFGAAR